VRGACAGCTIRETKKARYAAPKRRYYATLTRARARTREGERERERESSILPLFCTPPSPFSFSTQATSCLDARDVLSVKSLDTSDKRFAPPPRIYLIAADWRVAAVAETRPTGLYLSSSLKRTQITRALMHTVLRYGGARSATP